MSIMYEEDPELNGKCYLMYCYYGEGGVEKNPHVEDLIDAKVHGDAFIYKVEKVEKDADGYAMYVDQRSPWVRT